MLEIAGGIMLAVLILVGLGIALGIITIPVQVMFWLREAKTLRFAKLKRSELRASYRQRLEEIESSGRERYPNEASSLRKLIG